jgi:hypothetical protein
VHEELSMWLTREDIQAIAAELEGIDVTRIVVRNHTVIIEKNEDDKGTYLVRGITRDGIKEPTDSK